MAQGPGRRDSDTEVIHVAVDQSRRIEPPEGVVVHRVSDFDERVQWNLGPPRIRYEDSILDVAAAASDDLAAVEVLSAACGSRRTTATRLIDRLASRRRIARRRWLFDVLTDVAEGTHSVLEHGYLTKVERAHGLPRGLRQSLTDSPQGRTYRDVDYPCLGLIVELDGRMFHSSSHERNRDLDRDLDAAAATGAVTLRLGYHQVYATSCRTAVQVAAVMARLGWAGTPISCPDCRSLNLPMDAA